MTTLTVPTRSNIMRELHHFPADRSMLVATVGLHLIESNPTAYWTATSEMWEARGNRSGAARRARGADIDGGGADDHPAILAAFPQLALIVSLHLSDPDGVPMYALENGSYWLRNGQPATTARLWRCTLEDIEHLTVRDDNDRVIGHTAEISTFIDAQRDRWRAESLAAYEQLLLTL